MECDSAEKRKTRKQPTTPAEVYLPGRSRALDEDEELVMDKAAYRLYYQLHVEAPSLSFDILLDCLGENRPVEVDGDPVTAYIVAGTQTAHNKPNNLIVMKLSNMKPMTKKETTEKEDDEDSSDSDSDSEEDLDSAPELDSAKIPHNGTINRVRSHQFNEIYLTATWSELGEVNIWDLSRPLSAVNDSVIMSEYVRTREAPSPLFTFKGHQTEGYALAWSPLASAQCHLATGDVAGAIHVWQPRPTGWSVSKAYHGHEGSVEDIQWSPTEATVFLSASTDRSLRVWDTRSPAAKNAAMITLPEAHQSDVNVISWSRLQPVSVVSGADDGCIRVWDLRMVNQQCKSGGDRVTAFTHSFDYHRAAITSVEWHPNEAGIFVATSEDDQTTLWDITLEQEVPAAAAAADMDTDEGGTDATNDPSEVPVQLLFIHTGQHEVKEAHWHPQIPGLVINTAADGFNVFRTICV
ncbi:Glutamate-rich WD repeat-containing protein 1 [Sparganum proliferum]